MHSRRRLIASIHDVSPRFEAEVDQLIDVVQRHVGSRIALLVVPNHWRQSPIISGSPFATRLRRWAEGGFEIFLHGLYHQDEAAHLRRSDRLRANWMTAGEGEFLGLSKNEAASRIRSGRALLEDITGKPITGFIAPAWLYSRGAIEALTENNIPIAEDHTRVWSPSNGALLSHSPVITWASRSLPRRLSSMVAASSLRRLPVRDLRIGVHPGDCRSPQLLRSIDKTLRIARSRREPRRYADLLARIAN